MKEKSPKPKLADHACEARLTERGEGGGGVRWLNIVTVYINNIYIYIYQIGAQLGTEPQMVHTSCNNMMCV